MKLIDKAAVVAEIERRKKCIRMAFSMQGILHGHDRAYASAQYDAFNSLLSFLDTLEVKEVQEEPVSEDLEEAAHSYVDTTIEWFDSEGNPCCYPAFKAGAQWQKEQMITKACEWIKSHGGFTLGFDGATIKDFMEYINK